MNNYQGREWDSDSAEISSKFDLMEDGPSLLYACVEQFHWIKTETEFFSEFLLLLQSVFCLQSWRTICVPMCPHMEKLCFVDDIDHCLLWIILQITKWWVGLLCLGIRVCYKNTQCILTIRFALMTAVNRDTSLLHLMVILIWDFSWVFCLFNLLLLFRICLGYTCG